MLNNKPFKSPLLSRKPPAGAPESPRPSEQTGPPQKKRRVSEDSHGPLHAQPRSSQTSSTLRKPLISILNPATRESNTPTSDDGNEAYYMVLWRKFTTKKNKTWDGDGVLSIRNGYAYLQDIDGREMGKTNCSVPLLPGSTMSVGGKEIEVDSIIAKKDYLSGKPFLNTRPAPVLTPSETKERTVENKPLPSLKARTKQEKVEAKQVDNVNLAAARSSQATNGKFKNPLLDKTAMPKLTNTAVPQPRHDPRAPGALVMKKPASTNVPKGKQVVDVVVDPILSKHLRDHQREGVSFLYECVMGMGSSGHGAILADEMGLGKTLQSITLIWTLMKQNPIHEDPPVVKKTLVVAPAGTVQNWRREFRKWLGRERIGVFVADDTKKRLRDFTKGRCYHVGIIGFEKLQKCYQEISKDCQIDLIVIDESHRLKTAKNKSSAAIRSLNCDRIVSLSGTPFSNNLLEFHAVADLVNPGCLGKLSTFKREFENPIVRASQPEATAHDREKGASRQEELDRLVEAFMLRRKADVLFKYLPPKTEHILLCQPTKNQADIYRNVLASPVFKGALGSGSGNENAFQLINILKQVCNGPKLLSNPKSIASPNDTPEPESKISTAKAVLEAVPAKLLRNPGISAKLHVLDTLLYQIRTTTEEKVVVVSHYTTTLDMIGALLTSLSYPYLRIDGSVAANKRQDMINKFNNNDASSTFVFLLSTKAGGVGINLIGASRLILYDVDWNPAHELQAMARIHRDGQKRPCKIYRLLTMGALDEKIYQRQLSKQSLADSVIDNKSSGSSFTKEDLRDLFTLDESGKCQTHDLIACSCEGRGNGGGLVPSSDSEEPAISSKGVDDTDDDEDFPDLPVLLKASQVDVKVQEEGIKNSKKPKGGDMMALMQYAHIDASMFKQAPQRAVARLGTDDDDEKDAEDPAETVAQDVLGYEAMIDDEPLLQVLKERDSRVKFVFSKTTS